MAQSAQADRMTVLEQQNKQLLQQNAMLREANAVEGQKAAKASQLGAGQAQALNDRLAFLEKQNETYTHEN